MSEHSQDYLQNHPIDGHKVDGHKGAYNFPGHSLAVHNLTLIEHPLIAHKLGIMRAKDTSTAEFRRLLREISQLMAYEATRDLPLTYRQIETPLSLMHAPVIDGKKLCLVPILRAGSGMLEGMLDVLPSARVGHLGLYRDPKTLVAVEYYNKTPPDLAQRLVIVLDPMLATGHSAAAALYRLKAAGAMQLKFVSLLAAPQGILTLSKAHPDVQIFTTALDRELDSHSYIRPGLGDAGDRLYGTK
jgi:uracil phosphoribosyltransferase